MNSSEQCSPNVSFGHEQGVPPPYVVGGTLFGLFGLRKKWEKGGSDERAGRISEGNA